MYREDIQTPHTKAPAEAQTKNLLANNASHCTALYHYSDLSGDSI